MSSKELKLQRYISSVLDDVELTIGYEIPRIKKVVLEEPSVSFGRAEKDMILSPAGNPCRAYIDLSTRTVVASENAPIDAILHEVGHLIYDYLPDKTEWKRLNSDTSSPRELTERFAMRFVQGTEGNLPSNYEEYFERKVIRKFPRAVSYV
jgi:hypothetical protein